MGPAHLIQVISSRYPDGNRAIWSIGAQQRYGRITQPPSTWITWPVIQAPASEHSSSAPTNSSGVP